MIKFFNGMMFIVGMGITFLLQSTSLTAQNLPLRYATLELFTNTPCAVCASQNPGMFSRLANYDGQYHLIAFYPGSPYLNCIFYQANKTENEGRRDHYTGNIFGSPTVALNGIDFKSSNGVTTAVLDNLTGGTSWLYVDVNETSGSNRTVTINLEDVVGGSTTTGRLYAAIVEKEIMYNAPNGETLHHNVFRRFLTAAAGEDVDLSSGLATRTYQYDVNGTWNADQTYVIAWVMDPASQEILNSGTRFDADFTSAINPVQALSSLSLFPNPASSVLNITLPTGLVSADLEIFDQQGRLVRSLDAQIGPLVQISIADMTPGKFFLRLKSEDKIFTGSFEVVR